jgi:hypothetical protein
MAAATPESREQNDQSWIQLTRDQYVKTAAAFGVVVVGDASGNAQRIQGGRLYQRLHLAAIYLGLAMQLLNQIPERIDREEMLGLTPRFEDGRSRGHSRRGQPPLDLGVFEGIACRFGYA